MNIWTSINTVMLCLPPVSISIKRSGPSDLGQSLLQVWQRNGRGMLIYFIILFLAAFQSLPRLVFQGIRQSLSCHLSSLLSISLSYKLLKPKPFSPVCPVLFFFVLGSECQVCLVAIIHQERKHSYLPKALGTSEGSLASQVAHCLYSLWAFRWKCSKTCLCSSSTSSGSSSTCLVSCTGSVHCSFLIGIILGMHSWREKPKMSRGRSVLYWQCALQFHHSPSGGWGPIFGLLCSFLAVFLETDCWWVGASSTEGPTAQLIITL